MRLQWVHNVLIFTHQVKQHQHTSYMSSRYLTGVGTDSPWSPQVGRQRRDAPLPCGSATLPFIAPCHLHAIPGCKASRSDVHCTLLCCRLVALIF